MAKSTESGIVALLEERAEEVKMRRAILALLFCFSLSGCALLRHPQRPVHAPPEEAARVTFPLGAPEKGRTALNGTMLRAIELAMEDFLPWDATPHSGATALEICLYQRDSYDALAWPDVEGQGIVYVSLYPRPGACKTGASPPLDSGATYAVDVKGWRILAIQR